MPSPNVLVCRFVAAALCTVVAGRVRAELIKVSPFLPPQGTAAAPTANAPLEYRGSMEVADVAQYRVTDPAHKVGVWLKVGEREPTLDVTLKQHDGDRETIMIEHGGQTLTLPLRESKVQAGAGMPQMVAQPTSSMPIVSPSVTQSVVVNPTPADEQRRLEAVAQEVARRRALREQAQQQAQQQAAPQGTVQPIVAPPPPNLMRQDFQQGMGRRGR